MDEKIKDEKLLFDPIFDRKPPEGWEDSLTTVHVTNSVGDYVEVGCNSVLNPGTVIGRHSNVYPTSCVRGEIPENSIYKTGARIVKKA